jgi:hypothetical protein
VPEESVPIARAPTQPVRHGTSPWAAPDAQPATATRVQNARPVGAPLVLSGQDLGNRAPPPGSFREPLPLTERVRQSLGAPAPAATPPPTHARNPRELVPPARIPHARNSAEAIVTGSIGEKSAHVDDRNARLLSPRSLAEQTQ